LFLVGKGVCYDTGGADVKTGGAMRGMSRDKGGAAAVAGLMKTISQLQPTHLNVTASLAFVRNSIGSDAYVSDEIIVSRAGVRGMFAHFRCSCNKQYWSVIRTPKAAWQWQIYWQRLLNEH
jgi:hypothetical protein